MVPVGDNGMVYVDELNSVYLLKDDIWKKGFFLFEIKICLFFKEIDRAEAIMLHGDGNTLVVGLNNHLEFWLIRHG